jgi:hypothetical protein
VLVIGKCEQLGADDRPCCQLKRRAQLCIENLFGVDSLLIAVERPEIGGIPGRREIFPHHLYGTRHSRLALECGAKNFMPPDDRVQRLLQTCGVESSLDKYGHDSIENRAVRSQRPELPLLRR